MKKAVILSVWKSTEMFSCLPKVTEVWRDRARIHTEATRLEVHVTPTLCCVG